jgi:hypothetical protein
MLDPRKRSIWLGLALLVFAVAGCAVPRLGRPQVVNHSRPELAVDLQPFLNAGCARGEYGFWICPDDSAVAALGCDRLEEPSALLGGLDPALPLMLCQLSPFRSESAENSLLVSEKIKEEGFFYTEGCMLPDYIRYVVFQDGEFKMLKNQEELHKTFAPVTTSEEALSYALAATGLDAYYGLETTKGYRYLTDTLEDTYVAERQDGYLVHLFHYRFCGCGPHTTAAFDVLVSPDGVATRGDAVPQYEDPAEDTMCVD